MSRRNFIALFFCMTILLIGMIFTYNNSTIIPKALCSASNL
ncbi:MAG: hypothetical protein RSE00_03065 [Clostridia bacterium]